MSQAARVFTLLRRYVKGFFAQDGSFIVIRRTVLETFPSEHAHDAPSKACNLFCALIKSPSSEQPIPRAAWQ
jgi:hypothetical protein